MKNDGRSRKRGLGAENGSESSVSRWRRTDDREKEGGDESSGPRLRWRERSRSSDARCGKSRRGSQCLDNNLHGSCPVVGFGASRGENFYPPKPSPEHVPRRTEHRSPSPPELSSPASAVDGKDTVLWRRHRWRRRRWAPGRTTTHRGLTETTWQESVHPRRFFRDGWEKIRSEEHDPQRRGVSRAGGSTPQGRCSRWLRTIASRRKERYRCEVGGYGRSGSDSHGPISDERRGFVAVRRHASHVIRLPIHKFGQAS